MTKYSTFQYVSAFNVYEKAVTLFAHSFTLNPIHGASREEMGAEESLLKEAPDPMRVSPFWKS